MATADSTIGGGDDAFIVLHCTLTATRGLVTKDVPGGGHQRRVIEQTGAAWALRAAQLSWHTMPLLQRRR